MYKADEAKCLELRGKGAYDGHMKRKRAYIDLKTEVNQEVMNHKSK